MEPISHIVFPVIVLLAVNIEAKKVFTLLPLTLAPDLDTVFGLWAHRMVFHNFIFIFFIPFLIFLYIKHNHPEKLNHMYIGWFFLISHLILDLEKGFAFLWPFSTKTPYFSIDISATLQGIVPRIFLNIDAGIAPTTPEFSRYATLLSPSTSIIILLIIFSLFMNIRDVKTFFDNFRKFLLEKLSFSDKD